MADDAPLPAPQSSVGSTEPASTPQNARLKKAIQGCLWGTAVGDALGLPMEGLSRERQARMFPDLTRYHFLFGQGMVSDDTEHTWMVAKALLESGGTPETFGRSLARQMRWWLVGVPAGVGLATLRAILRLWVGISYTRSGVFSAGNGPSMRSAIIGVCWGHDLPRMRELVRVSTRITHTDPKAETGALLIALAAHIAATELQTNWSIGAFDTEDAPLTDGEICSFCARLTSVLPENGEEWSEALERVQGSVLAGETTEVFAARLGLSERVTGYILHTVPVALHAWLRFPRNYERAVTAVIRCGGDTDTVAAIVGAIVGASVGPEAIRREWRTGLWEWPHTADWISHLSNQLALSPVGNVSRARRVSILLLLARNFIFLLVVLVHGFRRLLPPY